MRTLAVGLVLVTCVLHVSLAADWPQWRGPNRDAISVETGWRAQWPAGGLDVLWKTNVGIGCSSVAVAAGRVFTLGNADDQDTLYCFDAGTGNVRWTHRYACPLNAKYYDGGPGATPTVDGAHVYSLSKVGQLFCLEVAGGRVVWSKDLQKDLGGRMPTWGYSGSPFLLDDWIIVDVGAPDAATVAFDKKTGTVVWKNGGEAAGYGTPALVAHEGQRCLALFNATHLTVRAAADGREIARFPWKTSYDVNAVTPIVEGDKLFISSGYNSGCALLQLGADGLKPLWRHKKMRNHFNTCVLWQGHLFGFDEGTLTCLDWATGTVKWTKPGLGKGSLMLADGKLLIQAERGDLVLAEPNPESYRELARAKVLDGTCWVVPVLAGGRIYCRNNTGDLVCLDAAGAPPARTTPR